MSTSTLSVGLHATCVDHKTHTRWAHRALRTQSPEQQQWLMAVLREQGRDAATVPQPSLATFVITRSEIDGESKWPVAAKQDRELLVIMASMHAVFGIKDEPSVWAVSVTPAGIVQLLGIILAREQP